jgi:hypothetical protein
LSTPQIGWDAYTVKEIKAKLRQLGAKVSGNRPDLLIRITNLVGQPQETVAPVDEDQEQVHHQGEMESEHDDDEDKQDIGMNDGEESNHEKRTSEEGERVVVSNWDGMDDDADDEGDEKDDDKDDDEGD